MSVNEQRQADIEDRLRNEIDEHRQNIKHETLSMSVAELIRLHQDDPKEINIKPEYQRLFRWTRKQQSDFIESLILDIPVPPLFFFENRLGIWELIDGLQRYSTMLKFMGHKEDVPPSHRGPDNNTDEWHFKNQNNTDTPSQLMEVEYLKSLKGISFSRLPTQLKLNLKRRRLEVYILKRETSDKYKYEVFKRLNRGGATLKDQEVRNCTIRLLNPEIANFLREIGKDQRILDILPISDQQKATMYPDEMALRFFAMKNFSDKFRHEVSDFLDDYLEQIASNKLAFDMERERDILMRVCSVIKACEIDRCFRTTGSFQPVTFELATLAITADLATVENAEPKEVRRQIEEFIKNVPVLRAALVT